MLPISTLPGPIDEENTYPPLPKYYFLIKTSLENGPKNGPRNSPIVQQSKGPLVQSIFYPVPRFGQFLIKISCSSVSEFVAVLPGSFFLF